MESVVAVPTLGDCASFTQHKSANVIVHLPPLQSSGLQSRSPEAPALRLGPTQPSGKGLLEGQVKSAGAPPKPSELRSGTGKAI